MNVKINSKDFRVRPGEKVTLKKWPTNVKPFCRSEKRRPLQKPRAAQCNVRPVAGNMGFCKGEVEAQPRRYIFCRGLKRYKKLLKEHIGELNSLQRLHYASNHCALLLIFQGMDAAGKDGVIRHVTSGVNPQGCEVFSFKQPSAEELEHDFLWRTTNRLPERGRMWERIILFSNGSNMAMWRHAWSLTPRMAETINEYSCVTLKSAIAHVGA